jgi:hypothetical protein
VTREEEGAGIFDVDIQGTGDDKVDTYGAKWRREHLGIIT